MLALALPFIPIIAALAIVIAPALPAQLRAASEDRDAASAYNNDS